MAVERLTRPALLIVDMQNDFVRVGAPLEVPQARDTIAVHRALIAFCRERAIPILYTKFVAGTVTQICVEETAREAFKRGYRTTIVSDAVSSYLPDLHAATLKNFHLKFGWVSTAKDLMEELRKGP